MQIDMIEDICNDVDVRRRYVMCCLANHTSFVWYVEGWVEVCLSLSVLNT